MLIHPGRFTKTPHLSSSTLKCPPSQSNLNVLMFRSVLLSSTSEEWSSIPSHLNLWTASLIHITYETLKIFFFQPQLNSKTLGQMFEASAFFALRQVPPPADILFCPPFLPIQLYEMFYSVMKHLPGPQQQAFKELQGLEDFIVKKVEQNQRTLDPNSPRNFIDSFLIRMQKVHMPARVRRPKRGQNCQTGMKEKDLFILACIMMIFTLALTVDHHCFLSVSLYAQAGHVHTNHLYNTATCQVQL